MMVASVPPESSPKPLLFVVDDDDDTRSNLADILELHDYRVLTASSAAALWTLPGWDEVAVILLDRRLPDGSPEELLPRMASLAPQAGVIIVTGYADVEGAVSSLRAGAVDYIVKPVNAEALSTSIRRELQRQRAQGEIQRLNRDLEARNVELDVILNVFPSDFAIAVAEDPECKFIHVNDCFARILGIAKEENASGSALIDGRPKFEIHSRGRPLSPEEMPLQQAARTASPVSGFECQIVRADGGVFDLLGYSVPLFDEQNQVRGAIAAFLDVTERRRAAETLARSEQRHRALFENAMDGFLLLDQQWRIVDANPAACGELRYERRELVWRELSELMTPAEAAEISAHLKAGDRTAGDCQLIRKDGGILEVEYRVVVGFSPGLNLFSLRNVTDRKRAEQRARQSERLAAIGETMAALVHESRNALQRSSACLEMLELEVEDRPGALDLVARAQRAQEQLRQLYEEVRQWAAPLKLRRESSDVAQVWREAWTQVIQVYSGSRPQLIEQLDTTPISKIDRFTLEQVFRNTFENALEVTPPGGKIWLTCTDGNGLAGAVLRVTIRDEGPGLSPEQQARIFEPFFTTKAKGTGLGMAICQRIVHAHEGAISASSPGGAQIEILLPKDQP